jgi:hypothetical protein
MTCRSADHSLQQGTIDAQGLPYLVLPATGTARKTQSSKSISLDDQLDQNPAIRAATQNSTELACARSQTGGHVK